MLTVLAKQVSALCGDVENTRVLTTTAVKSMELTIHKFEKELSQRKSISACAVIG